MARDPRSSLRLALLALATALALAIDANGQSANEPYEAVRNVLRKRGPNDARSARDLELELAQLGRTTIPILYDLGMRDGLDRLVADRTWDPTAWSCTPESVVTLARRALVHMPADGVESVVEEKLVGADVEERLVVVRVLSELGSKGGRELAWKTMASCDLGLRLPHVRKQAVEALTTILVRDPRSFEWIESRLEPRESGAAGQAPPAMIPVLVEAIAAAQRAEGQRTLEILLGRAPELEDTILEQMAELERLFPWRLEGSIAPHLARLARSMDWRDRRQAATLAASVHDLEFVPSLIDLVEDVEPRVRRAAATSLETMFRLPLGDEAEDWKDWYERERAWWETEAEGLAEALIGPDPGRANAALRALAERPLHRHEVARTIAQSLLGQPGSLGVNACAVLEMLGSRAAVPGLFAALEQGQGTLQTAALGALRELTGQDLPSSAGPWRAFLFQ